MHDTRHITYYSFYKRGQGNYIYLKKTSCYSLLDTIPKIIRAVWDIKGRMDMPYNCWPSFVRNLEFRYESLKRSTECSVLYIYFALY